jgi:hypothetical protein
MIGRNDDLQKEINIVKTMSKDINMNFGLKMCVRIRFKKGRVQRKIYIYIYIYIGSTFEKGIQELDPRGSYKYLGIEESYDKEHKNEKEKLKKEYVGRVRRALGTELRAKNNIQAIGSLVVPADTVLELLTGAKMNCKNWIGKRGNC